MFWLWFIGRQWVPRRIGTEGSFAADDPWQNDQPTTFTIEVYKMAHRSARIVRDSALMGEPLFGIKSEIDGKDRLLPEFLQALWKDSKVPSEALPGLLHRIEPQLNKSDYRVYGKRRILIEVMCGLYAVIAIVLLSVASKDFLDTRLGLATEMHREKPVMVGLSEWQRAPWQSDYVSVGGAAPVAAVVPLTTDVTVPPDVRAFPSSSFSVVVTTGGTGHLLLLVPKSISDANRTRPDTGYGLTGIVLSTQAVGFSSSLLSQLREKFPDLDTRKVLCLYWQWHGGAFGANPIVGAIIWGSFGALFGVLAGPMAMIFLPRFARRQRHTAWALQQAALIHA